MAKYGYTRIYSMEELIDFCKRKRKLQMVIFEGSELLPMACDNCNKLILPGTPNRVNVDPKTRTFNPYHYSCAWNSVFADIDRIGRAIAS